MVAARGSRGLRASVTARRELLRLAGAAAIAALAPRDARAQDSETNGKAAQDARRDAGRLGRRADDLLRATVADGLQHDAAAVRRFRTEQVWLGRDLSHLLNTRVGEDGWLLIVPARELDLALAMEPLFIRLVPTVDEVEAVVKKPLAQIEPRPGDSAEDVLLTIVLENLGIPRQAGLFETLRNEPNLELALMDAAASIKARRYGLAALELERLMQAVTLPNNVAAVKENCGEEGVYKLYKALVLRFVPFVGWSFFDTLLLATIYYNRDTTAPILR